GRDTVPGGVDLSTGGNQGGCYRLYQGSLMAVLPMLDHRPQLAALVKEKLDKAKGLRAIDGAFVLREALDAILSETEQARKPLWDRLGGEKAVRMVVHDFVLMAAADPNVNFLRDGQFKLDEKGVAHLEQLLVELISTVSGGPLKYTGRDMRTVHRGMKITEDEFNALAGHLVAALKKHKVPQAEIDELIAIVASTKGDIVELKK